MTRHTPRLALTAIGDANSPALWSGTPYNIVRALRMTGAEVVVVDVRPRFYDSIVDLMAYTRVPFGLREVGLRSSLRRERQAVRESIAISKLHSRVGSLHLARNGQFEGVVQVGTGYSVAHTNVVSYEDMTIAQARLWPETAWHDVPERTVQGRLAQQAAAYRQNRAATFSTEWAAKSAIVDSGCIPTKAHVVGIGANFIVDGVEERDWTTPRFLFAGRDWVRKGGPEVLAAFAEVSRRFPNAELHVAGDHPPISQHGVTGHGYLNLDKSDDRRKMLHLWSASTCCVVPSHYEPAGIVYVEALQAGIPSIGTTHGGASDIIGDAGVVVDPGNAQALTSAMLALCNPSTLTEFSARARRRREQFTWTHVATGLLRALGLSSGSVDP